MLINLCYANDKLIICIFRPEQFSDTINTSGKTQDIIPDDMLPPSDTDSDVSDTDNLGPICNPNRQERLCETDNTVDSDDSDTEQM